MLDLKQVEKEIEAGVLPREVLKKSLTRSTRLGSVKLNLEAKPLECGFPTIEAHGYLMEGEGNLIIMAARPGHGKTAFACNLGLNVAKKKRVLLFSLEMRQEAIYKRLLANVSGVPYDKMAMPIHAMALAQGKAEIEQLNFDIVDEQEMDIQKLIAYALDEYRAEPYSLLIIDYIGLIQTQGKDENKHREVGAAARRIKREIADALKIPVIVLAQMTRGIDSRYAVAEKKDEVVPVLSDIAESSGIEHAADIVMFLHRPHILNKNKSSSEFKAYVCKNRNGVLKDFTLEFSGSLQRFMDRGNIHG